MSPPLSDKALLFIILEVFLSPLVIIAVYKFYRCFLIRRWRSTPARIIGTELIAKNVSIDGVRGKTYIPKIVYEYQIGDKKFKSDRIKDTNYFLGERAEANKLLRRYQEGTEVNALYNPSNPAESILQRPKIAPLMLLFWIPVVFSIGVYFLFRNA